MRLNNKSAIVTGAGSGIGRAIAELIVGLTFWSITPPSVLAMTF